MMRLLGVGRQARKVPHGQYGDNPLNLKERPDNSIACARINQAEQKSRDGALPAIPPAVAANKSPFSSFFLFHIHGV
jgi:hypothetical protein